LPRTAEPLPASAPQSNVEIIFTDWLDALRRGDIETLAARLAPDVVHQGVSADLVCRNREQVLGMVGRRAGRLPHVDAVELIAAEDHVVMSVRGPQIGAPIGEGSAPRGQAIVVFTLRDGLIVRMQDYLHRADALVAAGASAQWE
jgi:ketosteroid isomerase-like protein